MAQTSPQVLFREEATVALPGDAAAVAINADESILAAAIQQGLGTWRVHLIDRPSRGKLGLIEATVGRNPRLTFSPVDDLLLISGSEGLQLWALPIAPMNPELPLPDEHRRWAVRTEVPYGDVAFGTPPDTVFWSVGASLYRRSTEPGAAYDPAAFWTAENSDAVITDLAFDPESAWLAMVSAQRKDIGLLDLNAPQSVRDLSGHRFPVVSARFGHGRPLLSLDAENNLVQWQGNAQPIATTYLEQVPEGFKAAGFTTLGDQFVLLLGENGQALAVEARGGRIAGELRAQGPSRFSVSPTGRYVLIGDDKVLRIYGFARPLAPLTYLRRLRGQQAYELAQSYVRLMDDTRITPQQKADLLNEAGREPPGRALQAALSQLRDAEQQGDSDQIAYWAEQILALQADHPQARAALRRLRDLRDAQALQRAREAMNLGQNRVAISLLSNQVQEDSPHYPEALQLIRQAEARRSLETGLAQAREKMDLGDYVAAEALVQAVLRKDSDNPAAEALMDEIDDRSGATQRRLMAGLIGGVLATLLVGFVALRMRRRMAPAGRRAPRGEGPAAAARTQAAGRAAGAQAREAEPDRPPPRPKAAGAARRHAVETLILETEQRLHHLREADVLGRSAAKLMELEAELSAIRRRAADPNADLGLLHSRLKTIHLQVHSMRAEPPPGGSAAGAGAGTRRQQERARVHQESAREQPPAPNPADANLTHYEILQLPPDASEEQIRAAYHKLIKQYHPDLHNASQFDWVRRESERMSRRIAEAYNVLGDATARARYDRQLRDRQRPAR